MTCILQSLDRAINYPFKKYLKHKYTDFILANNNIVKEAMMDARKLIVNHILEIWNGKDSNNKDYISPTLIKNSFKITGINKAIDGLEDYLFDGYDVINNFSKENENRKVILKSRDAPNNNEDNNINSSYKNQNINNNTLDTEKINYQIKENENEDFELNMKKGM